MVSLSWRFNMGVLCRFIVAVNWQTDDKREMRTRTTQHNTTNHNRFHFMIPRILQLTQRLANCKLIIITTSNRHENLLLTVINYFKFGVPLCYCLVWGTGPGPGPSYPHLTDLLPEPISSTLLLDKK